MSQQNQKNNKKYLIDRARAILSMSRALLTEVVPALRAASIKWDDKIIKLFFYYDGEISENEIDSISCVSAEVISDYPEHQLEEDSILRVDYPQQILYEGDLVYYRKELMTDLQRSFLLTKCFLCKGLCFDCCVEKFLILNRALWGRVSPQLRMVNVYWNDPKGRLVFYYDGEISEEDRQLSEAVRQEFLEYYPNYELELDIIRLDCPLWLPQDETGRTLFLRRENNLF